MARVRFNGGFLTPNGLNATIPLVELEIAPDMLTFRLRFGVSRLAGPWVLPRADVANVRVYRRGSWMSSGVRIGELDGFTEWFFWTTSPDEVVSLFHDLGYPVTGPHPWEGQRGSAQ